MNTPDLQTLNQEFAHKNEQNQLSFKTGAGDMPVIEIKNRHATAVISLQGAHLLSWIPDGEEEVIWLSDDAIFAPAKSVRGGVPVCWPWFGAHESNTSFPAHGFARTVNWQLDYVDNLENGDTRLSFSIQPQADNEIMWPLKTAVTYRITIGKKLELEISTQNNGDQSITIGQALHTYFKVGEISKVRLHGLDDTDYLDKPDNFKRKVQHGPVLIEQEVDRIYLDSSSDCVIEDNALQRNIIIIKCGSHSTVVWNPWQAVAEKMGDLGVEGYKKMLCVESSNAAEDVVVIEPGKSHQLWVQYEVQKITS